jgi:hypothetical protein
MKTILFCLLVLIGLQVPIPADGGSFLTSFDFDQVESNGVRILSCPSPAWSPGQPCNQISVIRWDRGQTWPDNGLEHKLKLDLSNRQGCGVKTSQELPLTGHQRASVQFYAPEGISDHIDLGILGDNIPAVQVTGYFALVGRNHNRLGPGYRLAIEKATPTANWLFPGTYPNGGAPFKFDPKRTYQLVIAASFDAAKVLILAFVEEWVPGTGWNRVASVTHSDKNSHCENDTIGKSEGYCQIVTGKSSFFGAIFQDNPIYFDQLSLDW